MARRLTLTRISNTALATLHEADRLVAPAERVLVPIEERRDGEEQLGVQHVHLLLRRLLDLVDVQGRAEEHGDVDAARQRQVEAAPVEEDGRLCPARERLHEAPLVEPRAVDRSVADGVDHLVLLAADAEDACDAIGHHAHTHARTGGARDRLARDVDAAEERHVAEKGRAEDDGGGRAYEVAAEEGVERRHTDDVGERQHPVRRARPNPRGRCERGLVVVARPHEAVGEVAVHTQHEP
eukprot:scaffold30550_cov66-Phaeocystis_antarctica.AAC.12